MSRIKKREDLYLKKTRYQKLKELNEPENRKKHEEYFEEKLGYIYEAKREQIDEYIRKIIKVKGIQLNGNTYKEKFIGSAYGMIYDERRGIVSTLSPEKVFKKWSNSRTYLGGEFYARNLIKGLKKDEELYKEFRLFKGWKKKIDYSRFRWDKNNNRYVYNMDEFDESGNIIRKRRAYIDIINSPKDSTTGRFNISYMEG